VTKKVAAAPAEPSVAPTPTAPPAHAAPAREKSLASGKSPTHAEIQATPRASKGVVPGKSGAAAPTSSGAAHAWKDPFVDGATPRTAPPPATEKGKASGSSKALSSDRQAQPPAGKTGKHPGPVNNEL